MVIKAKSSREARVSGRKGIKKNGAGWKMMIWLKILMQKSILTLNKPWKMRQIRDITSKVLNRYAPKLIVENRKKQRIQLNRKEQKKRWTSRKLKLLFRRDWKWINNIKSNIDLTSFSLSTKNFHLILMDLSISPKNENRKSKSKNR